MGSGKSFLGKRLAERLGYRFIDLDSYIEVQTGRSIPEYFAEGEEAFRIAEARCLRELEVYEKVVIATGGGTPCYKDNIKWINAHGTSIYLNASPKLLYEHLLPQRSLRPLLADLKEEQLLDFIRDKLEERLPVYEQAQFIVAPELEALLAVLQD